MNQSGWGTSGRHKLAANYLAAVLPLALWALLLLRGLVPSLWSTRGPGRLEQPLPEAAEARHLAAGAGAYVGYWAVMLAPLLGGRAKALPAAGGEATASRCEAGCTGRWLGERPGDLGRVPGAAALVR